MAMVNTNPVVIKRN